MSDFFVTITGPRAEDFRQVFGTNLSLAEALAPEPEAICIAGDADPHLMTEMHVCLDCYCTRLHALVSLAEKVRQRKEEL